MRRENVKPSLVTYYLTRSSLIHPLLAITQVNIGIYLLFAAPYINNRFYTVSAPMFFRQLCCLILIFMFGLATQKFHARLTLRDWKYCILVGLIGISTAQYFQLENFKTLLYQSGVYRLATWQPIVPVFVTCISLILKLEKSSFARKLVMIVDFTFLAIVIIIRVFWVNEYGENDIHDKKYLFYMLIVILSSSIQFILTKRLISRSSINLVIFAFWVYLFGLLGTACIYVIECLQRGAWTIGDMPHILYELEEVIGVLIFSCFNEVINYILLLYLMKKTFITKASLYGILSAIVIIFESAYEGKIHSPLLWTEVVVFLTGYIILFVEKRREKYIVKHKTETQHVKYIKNQEEDEIHKLYVSSMGGSNSQNNSPKSLKHQLRKQYTRQDQRSPASLYQKQNFQNPIDLNFRRAVSSNIEKQDGFSQQVGSIKNRRIDRFQSTLKIGQADSEIYTISKVNNQTNNNKDVMKLSHNEKYFYHISRQNSAISKQSLYQKKALQEQNQNQELV